ncbi:hypothetical protein DL768_008928 [Monosporascus sp. mg162]|nr:hypothetical protein DL768_008928 [Monosporascus sp. mg162]
MFSHTHYHSPHQTLRWTLLGVAGVAAFSILGSPVATSSALSKREDCLTEGDGDLYGLGVRLGLYLQWAAGFILRNLGSWETVSRVRTASNTLCSAIAVAAAINLTAGTALSVDYLLSFYLTVVLFYAESYNLVIEEPAQPDYWSDAEQVLRLYPDFPLVFQNILFATYTLFGAWFWTVGIHKARSPSCVEEAAVVFLFDIRSLSWTKTATVLSVLTGAIFALIFVIHLVGLKKGIEYGPVLVATWVLSAFSGAVPTWGEMRGLLALLLHPKGPRLQRKNISRFLFECLHFALIFLAGPVIAIVSVERMILANALVTPAISASTGQTIALFTGVVSMLMALWEAREWNEARRKKAERNPTNMSSGSDQPAAAIATQLEKGRDGASPVTASRQGSAENVAIQIAPADDNRTDRAGRACNIIA